MAQAGLIPILPGRSTLSSSRLVALSVDGLVQGGGSGLPGGRCFPVATGLEISLTPVYDCPLHGKDSDAE